MNPINNLFQLLSVNHSSTLNKTENNSVENSQNEQNHNGPSNHPRPFSPSFSNPDNIFKIIQELGFCDGNGVFNGSCSRLFIFEILKNSPSFLNLQSRINNLLDKKFTVLSGPIIYLEKNYPVNIKISLREILKYIEKIVPLTNGFPVKIPETYLVECYLIGSELTHLIGKDCFIEMCYRLFSEKIDAKTLETWFSTMEHFSEQIDREGADLDLRVVLSCNNIDSYAFITQSILEWLTIKILNSIYKNSSNEPICKSYPDLFNYCKSFLLKSSGIRHFNRVDKGSTKCTILSLNTDYKPIDINVVGLDNKQLTLENPNLSSLNCYALPLLGFLSHSPLEKIFIDSHPFYGQALIDLLLSSMTPTTYNEDGWKHALRKGQRFLNPSYQKKMVNDLVEKKDQVLAKLDSKRVILPEEKRNNLEGYIYLVIYPYFKKIENEIPSIEIEPYYLGEFIFRVCEFLEDDSNFNNEIFYQLWKLVDSYYWKGQNKGECSSSSIYTQMKIALIEDRVPWNVFAAYLEILVWLWDSDSATIHNGKPYFHLKKPFHIWIKIQLNQSLEKFEHYFSVHTFPDSLKKIGEIFSVEKITAGSKHPLKEYLSVLGINTFTFTKNIENLLNSSSNNIQTIGLHLYLLLFESFPSDQLHLRIYQHQNQLINGVFNQYQEKMIYEKLKDFHEAIAPFKLIVKEVKKQSSGQLNQEKLDLLLLLISSVLLNNECVEDALSIIINFIQEIISVTPGFESIDNRNIWESLDQFLVSPEFMKFSQKVYQSSVENNIELKNFFLRYLNKSFLIGIKNREKFSWEIFQQTLKLFPKIRNAETKALNLNISISLAILIKETSFIPDRILKWFLEFQTVILECLYKNNHIDHLRVLLKTLQKINPLINHQQNYSREIFKLDWGISTLNHDILSLLNKNDVDFLKACIKPDEYSKLINLLVLMLEKKVENELIEDLIEWICQVNIDQAIFQLPLATQFQTLNHPLPFDQSKFNDLLLLYCEAVWRKSQYAKFIHVFQYLSYQDVFYKEKLNTLSCESWKTLWTFLLDQNISTDEHNDLITNYWHIYKISKYSDYEHPNREVFTIAVSCLKESSSEFISLMMNDEWLKMWGSDSLEIVPLLNSMFTRMIKGLSLNPFNEQFFISICEFKKYYFEKIQLIKHKNSLKTAHQWEQKINDELLKHLSQNDSISTIKALFFILNNKIQSSQFKYLNKNELWFFFNLCQNLNKFKNELGNSDFELVYPMISVICQKIRFQNEIETEFFIKLIECLEKQACSLKWLQIVKFFPIISQRNDQKNINHLVPMYLKGITYLLNYFSENRLDDFNKDYLEEVFIQAKSFSQISSKLKIPQKQTVFISYLFFKYSMIEKNIKKIQFSEQTLLNDVQLFKEFFPKFLNIDKFLAESLEWMGITLAQHTQLFSERHQLNQAECHLINKALFDILFVKITARRQNESLKNYYQQALSIIFNKKIEPSLFVEALHFVGNEYLRLFKEKKIEFNEVVELIDEISFFFPVTSWENDDEIASSNSSGYLKNHKIYALDLLQKLKESNRSYKFLSLDIYLHPELLHDVHLNKKNKNEKNELFKLLDRLLAHSLPNESSLMIAGVILPKIIPSLELDELNKLRTYYLNFFEFTKNLNLLKQPHGMANVLNYNIKKTECTLINCFPKEKKIVHEFLTFLYPSAYNILNNLISNFKNCQEQFDLMFTSIELIESQFEKSHYDPKSVEEYLDKLHQLKPVFLLMLNEFQESDANVTNLAKTITSLMDALITMKITQKLLCNVNVNASNLLKQRESFFEFLDALYIKWMSETPESKKLTFLIFIPYLKLMTEINDENKNFSFLNKHQIQLKEKFKDVIEKHGTLFEKAAIKIIDFLKDDSLVELEANNLLFTSIIDSIFDIKNKDQLLTVLKMTSVLFFENSVKNKIKKNVFETLFKFHLKLLKNYFKEYNEQIENSLDFLITYTVLAMKKKLFDSQEESVQFFCWISQCYHLFDRKDPLFDLFSLRYTSEKGLLHEEGFEIEALKLMPDLCHYVLQTGNFFYSHNLIDLIIKNITDNNKKNIAIVNWLRTFEIFSIKKDDKILCESHINEILQKRKNISLDSFPSRTLTFKYVKNEEFPSKDYLSLNTITIKKCIAEYFNLTNF